MTYSTAGLTRLVRNALKAHHGANKPQRVRALTPDDTSDVVKAVRAAVKQARVDDVIIVRAYGGIVPNGYGYRAAGDNLKITVDLSKGPEGWNLSVVRGHAPSRAHGRGDLITARLLAPGQASGRRVAL